MAAISPTVIAKMKEVFSPQQVWVLNQLKYSPVQALKASASSKGNVAEAVVLGNVAVTLPACLPGLKKRADAYNVQMNRKLKQLAAIRDKIELERSAARVVSMRLNKGRSPRSSTFVPGKKKSRVR